MLDMTFDPSLALLAGIALLLIISMRLLMRRRSSNETEYAPPAKPRAPQSLPTQDAPAELLRWQVQMHETARDLKAELDSKMSALQALVRMARQECQRLEELLDRSAEESPPDDDAN
jgi:flagellar biosynthesis/type III secretory pathway M-ring protein FliF/YscJ